MCEIHRCTVTVVSVSGQREREEERKRERPERAGSQSPGLGREERERGKKTNSIRGISCLVPSPTARTMPLSIYTQVAAREKKS